MYEIDVLRAKDESADLTVRRGAGRGTGLNCAAALCGRPIERIWCAMKIGFCFGESKDSYDQFWQDVLGYSGPLKGAIDNLGTRINADRNKGIRASVNENLVHGDHILHNDAVLVALAPP
jgi:hypothetical protein